MSSESMHKKGLMELIFPLKDLQFRLENSIKRDKRIKKVVGETDIFRGHSKICFSDKKGNAYSIHVFRDMPRYTVSFASNNPLRENVEDYIKNVCAGEACVDVNFHDGALGAIPLDYHNV